MRSLKHKQRIKIALLLVVISITIVGIIGGKRMNEPTEKEKQIAFLKKHEEEMTEYVKKSEGNKIFEVEYNWDSVNEGTIGNGLPNGAGKKIQIFGFVNNNLNLDFRLDIVLDKNDMPIMSTLHFGQKINL